MDDRAGVLVDYTAAIDFCQPSLPEYEQTRQVLEDINSHGLRIDIRQECWSRLTDSLGNSIKVFMTLRDEASEHLKACDDAAAALELFTDEVLQASTLEDIGVDMNKPSVPDVEELEDAVREMGLRKFREYADDHVRDCPRGQQRLELLIDNRYTKSGESQTFFEAGVRRHIINDTRVRLLLGAYSWSKTNPGYLLTRCNSDIHEKKSEIEQCMSDDRFSIVCPEDYTA
jgi:hypothetical protein